MDIREIALNEYLKMCKEAHELQLEAHTHSISLGDWFYNPNYDMDKEDKYPNFPILVAAGWEQRIPDVCVWLPTQENLQAFWGKKLPENIHWFNMYAEEKVPGIFTSMEQLWLAFVMKEKYNKVWNGKEWVRESKCLEFKDWYKEK